MVSQELFNLAKEESHGTHKMFAFAGPILDTLERGGILFIDEIDSGLHPDLVSFIIRLFNSKKNNPNNAQLLSTNHNTDLLNQDILRRDQIWFVEKHLLAFPVFDIVLFFIFIKVICIPVELHNVHTCIV